MSKDNTPLEKDATSSFSSLYRISREKEGKEYTESISKPLDATANSTTSIVSNNGNDDNIYKLLDIDKIIRNDNQPRSLFKDEPLDDLIASIREKGVESPIRVFQSRDDQFTIVFGERRWRAAQAAGLKIIPAIIQQSSEPESVFTTALIENIQRENLHFIEQARAFKRMIDEGYCKTNSEIAKKLGISRSSVNDKLKVTDLPEDILNLIIKTPQISLSHTLHLTDISNNPDLCKQLIKQMTDKEISRDTLKKIIESKLHGTRHKASFKPFDYKPHSKGFNLEVKYRKDRPEDKQRVIKGLEDIIEKLKQEGTDQSK